jgi:hypothetical protein
MVREAILLPNVVVENVARLHGDVSIEAVRETYTEEEIAEHQRRAREGDGTVTVIAALEKVERERVEEAAAEAGQPPGQWLAEATVQHVSDRGPVAGPETVGDQVEQAIFRRSEV